MAQTQRDEMALLDGIQRRLLVDGTVRIFHLLGEIDAKLEMAIKQAATLRAMLEPSEQTGTPSDLSDAEDGGEK